MIGLRGLRVEAPTQLSDTWMRALAADRPVVVEAIVDPEVALLPPHITFEQARHFTEVIARGDTGSAGMIRQVVRDLVRGR